MKQERDKIAAKIRALLAKTVENGCTEDEALSAARMAAALLEKHNMTMDETQLRENPMKREASRVSEIVGDRLWKVAKAISALTGARYWQSPSGVYPVTITFFGFEHEVQVSQYVLEICTRATEQAAKRVERDNVLLVKRKRVQMRIAFVDGMLDRLAQRIQAMVPPVAAGTGLVVLRDQLIDKALEDEGVKLNSRDMRKSRDFDPNYLDGYIQGSRVSLNRGLSDTGSDGLKQIR
jgi:hypothetical protein